MRLQSKRRIDEFVGNPLLFVLNYMALLLGTVLRRTHQVLPVRRILVLKFQGMGSLILAKPGLRALRREYPQARIVLWGSPATVELARHMPEFDECIVLDDRTFVRAVVSLVRCLFRLWRQPPDWAFDLEVYSKLSSILMTLTCARNRAGFAVDTIKNRQWAHTHLIYFNRYRFLGQAYGKLLGLAQSTAAPIDTSDYGSYSFGLEPLPEIPKPYFVFNIHAGELSLERRWPQEYFRVLIAKLLEHVPEASGVLIGHGAFEVAECAKLPAHPRLVNLAGKLDLKQTVRVLANARLVVSNDTAPLHLALSTGSPLVGLFGPTRAATYFPEGRPGAIALSLDFFCSPCIHHWEPIPCGGDNQCLKSIPVSSVLAACCSLLSIPVPACGPEAGPFLSRPEYNAGLLSSRYIPPRENASASASRKD